MEIFGRLKQQGFTLIEVIMTLVLAGFLAAMFTPAFNQTFQKSASQMKDYQRTLYLMGVMENITAYYLHQERLTGGDVDLTDMKNKVGAEGTTQADNAFGQKYDVVTNRFIKFDSSGNEMDIGGGDPEDLLKITIRHSITGQELTSLFARFTAP